MPFLIKYNAEYYLGWVRRTLQFAGHLHQRFPWLKTLCEQSEKFISLLSDVLPGRYRRRILSEKHSLRGGTVYPVDWESGAVAAGEVDLEP